MAHHEELERTVYKGPEGERQLSREEWALVEEGARLNGRVQMRIETFYFFARRLLDEVVVAIDSHFRPSRTTIGGAAGLAKNLPALVSERSLRGADALLAAGETALTRVKDFRDDEVAHLHTVSHALKTRGLMWSDKSPPRMSVSRVGRNGTQTRSDPISELMEVLTGFVEAALLILEMNSPEVEEGAS